MKNSARNFFKPTFFKLGLATTFLAWQYFYNFQGTNVLFSKEILDYLSGGLTAVTWNNFFVKNLSLIGVWLALATLIYISIIGFEFVSNAIHNARVKQSYQNQKPEDFAHLLKPREIFLKTHFLTYLLWTGAVILILAGFLFVSGQMEALRFTAYDNLFWSMIEGGVEFDYNSFTYTVVSFVAFLPFWCLYSAIIVWIFREGRYEEEKDKITQEHYAVVVDDASEEDQSESL